MSQAKELVIEISEVNPPKELQREKQFDHVVALMYVPKESNDRVAVTINTCLSFGQAIQFATGLSNGIKLLNPDLPLSIEYIDMEENVSLVPIM